MLNHHKLIIAFFVLLSFSILAVELVYSEPFNFGNLQNLSNGNAQHSQFVEIATFDKNVFITWLNSTSNEIYFTKSTNNGTSFSTPIKLSGADNVRDPKITTNNNDSVYLSWIDDDNLIPEIISSTNNGTSFGSIVDIGTDLNNFLPDQVRLAANNGTTVYVVWLDDDGFGNIETFLRQSTDNGGTFGSTVTISDGDGFASSPQVTTNADTNVYLVWQNDPLFTNGFDDIFFSASIDSGSSFIVSESILSDSSSFAQMPQIATGNTTNVYATWQQFDGSREQVLFSSSINNGTSFDISQLSISGSTGTTGSTSPQIAASGNNVYVVWQDDRDGDNDIYFRSSANNGTSFTPILANSPLNISSNTGESTSPKIAASGDNVFIVWQDDSFGSTEILFASSTDKGITFGNTVRLTNTPAASNLPNVAATPNFAHVVWEEDVSGDFQAFYSSGIPPIISFNATTFRTYDTGSISIDSSSSNTNSTTSQTIIAQITSDTDPIGISLVLTETNVNTGIFEASIDFTSGISSGTTLQVKPGDVITTTFDGSSATASIFPIIISFNNPTYDLGGSAIITITDQNSNVTASTETIIGTVTSTTFPGGISLSFTETGPKTGIFQNTYLIFMTGNDLFSFTDNVKISQFEDAGGQTTDNTITTLQVDVDSTTAPGVIGLPNLILTETGQNTGQFEEIISFTSLASSGTSLKAAMGDVISVLYNGATSNGLIIPAASTIGAIQASIGDTITASFGIGSGTANIIPGGGGGGGGGGLIRPGLIVDVVASVFTFGGGGSSSGQGDAPTFRPPSNIRPLDYVPISINGNNFSFDDKGNLHPIDNAKKSIDKRESSTVKIYQGKDTQIKFKIYSPLGKDHIQHVAVYTNTQERYPQDISSSTAIIYDKDKDLKVFNGMGKLSDANMIFVEENDYVTITLDLNFADVMDKSDIVLKIWDVNRFSSTTYLDDVIEVVNVSKEITLPEIPISEVPNEQESTSLNSMTKEKSEQIKQTINEWGGFSSKSVSDAKLLEDLGIEGTKIPLWFKETARWINNEQITLDDFVNAVNYLAKKNLLS